MRFAVYLETGDPIDFWTGAFAKAKECNVLNALGDITYEQAVGKIEACVSYGVKDMFWRMGDGQCLFAYPRSPDKGGLIVKRFEELTGPVKSQVVFLVQPRVFDGSAGELIKSGLLDMENLTTHGSVGMLHIYVSIGGPGGVCINHTDVLSINREVEKHNIECYDGLRSGCDRVVMELEKIGIYGLSTGLFVPASDVVKHAVALMGMPKDNESIRNVNLTGRPDDFSINVCQVSGRLAMTICYKGIALAKPMVFPHGAIHHGRRHILYLKHFNHGASEAALLEEGEFWQCIGTRRYEASL